MRKGKRAEKKWSEMILPSVLSAASSLVAKRKRGREKKRRPMTGKPPKNKMKKIFFLQKLYKGKRENE